VGKKVVAQIELDIARDADHNPARQKQEDAADGSDLQHLQCEMHQLRRSDPGVEIVHRVPDYLRQKHPRSVAEKNADNARHEAPAVALEVGQ